MINHAFMQISIISDIEIRSPSSAPCSDVLSVSAKPPTNSLSEKVCSDFSDLIARQSGSMPNISVMCGAGVLYWRTDRCLLHRCNEFPRDLQNRTWRGATSPVHRRNYGVRCRIFTRRLVQLMPQNLNAFHCKFWSKLNVHQQNRPMRPLVLIQ